MQKRKRLMRATDAWGVVNKEGVLMVCKLFENNAKVCVEDDEYMASVVVVPRALWLRAKAALDKESKHAERAAH